MLIVYENDTAYSGALSSSQLYRGLVQINLLYYYYPFLPNYLHPCNIYGIYGNIFICVEFLCILWWEIGFMFVWMGWFYLAW